ncbi:MAG: cupin domain-containing protein [Hyphomonas sp.]
MHPSATPPQSFIVASSRDRAERPGQIGPDTNTVKVSARDTGGAFSLFEYTGRAEGGPPLHVHPDQDEIFFVQEGRYLFQCGPDRSTLEAGDMIFLPRSVPHTFCQISPQGRLLYMYTPAGDMEAFFEALASLEGPPLPAEAGALFARHGMEVVGPPLAAG